MSVNTSSTNNGDAYIRSLSDSNFGSEIQIYAGILISGEKYRSAISFTTPNLNYKINSVKLFLYRIEVGTNNLSKTVDIHSLDRNDWVENQIKWTQYKTGSDWTTAGGDFDSEVIDSVSCNTLNNKWDEFDLTDVITDWDTRYDFFLKIDNESTPANNQFIGYASKDYTTDTSKRPYLEIIYSIELGAESGALSLTGQDIGFNKDIKFKINKWLRDNKTTSTWTNNNKQTSEWVNKEKPTSSWTNKDK